MAVVMSIPASEAMIPCTGPDPAGRYDSHRQWLRSMQADTAGNARDRVRNRLRHVFASFSPLATQLHLRQ